MGRPTWLERIEDLEDLGAGPVMISRSLVSERQFGEIIVYLRVGTVEGPSLPMYSIHNGRPRYSETIDTGEMVISTQDDSLPEAIYRLWHWLANLDDDELLYIPARKGRPARCAKKNLRNGWKGWEFLDPPAWVQAEE